MFKKISSKKEKKKGFAIRNKQFRVVQTRCRLAKHSLGGYMIVLFIRFLSSCLVLELYSIPSPQDPILKGI